MSFSFRKGIVSPKVFHAIQTVNMRELSECTEQEIRPVLPCLVRMGLISPLDTSKKCTTMKVDILTIVSGMELVNSIVALLSIDFHRLESEVKKEQQLRQKCTNGISVQNDSILIGNLTNTSMALEYERSDMTRRLSIVLGELIFIQSQIQELGNDCITSNSDTNTYIKSSELFDNDIFAEELSDIICIALAELPLTLNYLTVIHTLLHLHNGPAIICRIVANFPDCFREVCTYLIQSGEKQEESKMSTIRSRTIQLLCKMNPKQSLTIRSKCIELCRMPALAIQLSLEYFSNDNDNNNDMVAFISGLLLGNDQTIRNWIALFIRTGQKKKGEISSVALQQLRDNLLKYLNDLNERIMSKNNDVKCQKIIPDELVVKASSILRLYCALRGIGAIKFNDNEITSIVQLLINHHPTPTPSGVRFVSIGLCMLIACPSLLQQEYEKKCIEWIQWLIKEESYFESINDNLIITNFGEMLLLMAIHFHSNQLSAICDLICSTLGMKIPIRHNNMTRMKQIFTQDIFTEQIVTAHAVKVPVTKNLNSNMIGFLPIHCIYQLLKSRAFIKYNVNIKNWIYKQICTSTYPLHPILPMLIEVYVNNLIVHTTTTTIKQQQQQQQDINKPLSECEIKYVFQNSIFGKYLTKKQQQQQQIVDLKVDINNDNNNLTPQLLLLYYLLLYEDLRLNYCTQQQQQQHNNNNMKKLQIYSNEFMNELPIKYLLYYAQNDQTYSSLFGSLLKLLVTHFPHLTLVDDWLDDMVIIKANYKIVHVQECEVIEAFNVLNENPSNLIKLLQKFLQMNAIDIWPFAELLTNNIKKLLNTNIPRYLQDLYKDVWLRLNTILPRRLWLLTIKNLIDDYTNLNRIDFADDPLQIMRCDERVFRCAPIYAIVLRVLRASLASSRSQLLQHLQQTTATSSTIATNENEREEMCRATIAAQESGAVQMLLETCLETDIDRNLNGQQWSLQEIRSLVCSFLHQMFIADTMLAKLIHFQGYPSELIEVTVKGIPSMHICLDFLQELMQQPNLNKQIFAIQLLSFLSMQYALPKSLNLCVNALNLLYALLGNVSTTQRVKLFKAILPSLVNISEAFPPLIDDIINLLMQLGKICKSQISLTSSHFNGDDNVQHFGKMLEVSAQENRKLIEFVQETFQKILDKAVLKSIIYKQE